MHPEWSRWEIYNASWTEWVKSIIHRERSGWDLWYIVNGVGEIYDTSWTEWLRSMIHRERSGWDLWYIVNGVGEICDTSWTEWVRSMIHRERSGWDLWYIVNGVGDRRLGDGTILVFGLVADFPLVWFVCLLVSVPQLKPWRSLTCWVRRSRVQPFPHACTILPCVIVYYKCGVACLSGNCTPTSGIVLFFLLCNPRTGSVHGLWL